MAEKLQNNQLCSIAMREYLDDLKHLSKMLCKKNICHVNLTVSFALAYSKYVKCLAFQT